jgi:hypothetical protein
MGCVVHDTCKKKEKRKGGEGYATSIKKKDICIMYVWMGWLLDLCSPFFYHSI